MAVPPFDLPRSQTARGGGRIRSVQFLGRPLHSSLSRGVLSFDFSYFVSYGTFKASMLFPAPLRRTPLLRSALFISGEKHSYNRYRERLCNYSETVSARCNNVYLFCGHAYSEKSAPILATSYNILSIQQYLQQSRI
jgi:hypothetical protein